MPGWQGSTRRQTLPPDWEQRRQRQFQLDGYRCTAILSDDTRCTEPAEECDHKTNRWAHEPGVDLQSLCSWHHGKKSGREGQMARRKQLAKASQKFRRTEAHPGL